MKIRQGDVIIVSAVEPKDLGVRKDNLVLAYGEVTGHSHRIVEGQAELYERDGVVYLKVLSEVATLGHEEHKAVSIPNGVWEVRIQREYKPDGWRRVVD